MDNTTAIIEEAEPAEEPADEAPVVVEKQKRKLREPLRPLNRAGRRQVRAAYQRIVRHAYRGNMAARCDRCGFPFAVPQNYPAAFRVLVRCQCKATVERRVA